MTTVAALVKDARRHAEQPLPPVSEDQIDRLRYVPTDLLKDAQDLCDVDEEAASWLVFKTLQAALEVHYRLHRRPSVKGKDLLEDLRQYAPDLEPRVRRLLSTRATVRSRCFWLTELVKDILEPLGGLLREWESPRTVVEGTDVPHQHA